ncbi:tRNA (adenosine(37)-N6)-threonylcarbamoyltransferase complex ATPase subunit type 1 TsaE [Algoriphagus boritolerans]|uniref:tRNA threonylcarbamoyladenosine biosynthesis protein TsaE n=1 Tax=Algoriphagus boritolerans DSM 17298 = JCM 18970 TaxID=1120964 RepID=A0A1H5ZV24_9BACT|nr:tRNA (adenosine(37)-N6)-threonylcarbamoyltransferase complex ATPase subunit type 1 TsaE [Algoriphagus boritolerans]SEG40051.1 tRNA threonylcarbamoyladenosine biosynthesis protein TsaE [Algoriphagus boritolerans DSM 17298 = JCM 18970]
MNTIHYRLDQIQDAARQIIARAGDKKIWVFQGQMGAGKTTLIKALSKELEVQDQVSSPTFGIVNEYETISGQRICHFDFYRIDDPREALDIGIEEYFYSGDYCWIEWAEKIAQFLPDEFLLIKIVIDADEDRTITLQHTQNVN